MGMAHYLTLIYWIVPTVHVYGKLHIILASATLILFCCYLALYPAFFAFFMAKLPKENHLTPLWGACLWTGLEYLRTYALTGFPFYEGTHFAASFGHLMGGYDAGYYGYLWSKVYGDDMFSVFANEGILSPEVGRRYRDEVLAMGHSRDAIDHLLAFLGREPSSEAFLAELGLDPAG